MNNEFVPTVTISLKKYEDLIYVAYLNTNLPDIQLLLKEVLRFNWSCGNRGDLNNILLRIREITERNIWDKK